ncbi:SRPBCC family protein [Neorhizobium sp. T786]|uniref:SRPBCC family protein n=1 Tax=Pseudorhizobium xiangyangii TaxID=2883104 RepID=UPI001CFFABCA|nr:SRPBCC family protein [Neorhizobium xiangyangii]
MPISQTIQIEATADVVFSFYRNIESWPRWDPEVKKVHLPNGLLVGSNGVAETRSGPRARYG